MEERFWSKVRITGDEHSCWEWTAAKFPAGYGAFGNGKKVRGAHRVAYEMTSGPVPDGLQLDHLCRNRACVNPWHLEAVTQQENIRRGNCGKHHSAKTHCKHGHEYSSDNTYQWKNGKTNRMCKTCKVEYQRRYRATKGTVQ